MPETNVDQHGQPRTRYIYSGSRYGYYVKLPATAGLKQRFFGVTRHGSAAGAYNAAVAWRDQRLSDGQRNRVLRSDRGRYRSKGIQDRRQLSLGKTGVTIKSTASQSRHEPYPYVRASIRDPRSASPKCQDFSIERYGLETAMRYALRKRLEWERKFYGHRSLVSEDDWLRFMLLWHSQFGDRTICTDEIKHPGTVTRPDPNGVQARVTIRRQERSAYFNYRKYGSSHEAHVAAILWCIQTHEQENPSGGYRVMHATRRNKTTSIAGVSRTVKNDRRGQPVVMYQVSVKVNGKRTSMGFTVGRVGHVTAEQETFTLDIATRCRRVYEQAHDAGMPFDRTPWRGWKRRYGFPSNPKGADASQIMQAHGVV